MNIFILFNIILSNSVQDFSEPFVNICISECNSHGREKKKEMIKYICEALIYRKKVKIQNQNETV